jgi:hypothetical protein
MFDQSSFLPMVRCGHRNVHNDDEQFTAHQGLSEPHTATPESY